MRKGKKYRIIAWVVVILVVIAAAFAVSWMVMTQTGRLHLRRNATSKMPSLGESGEQGEMLILEEDARWQDDWIRFDGQIYDFNENILTFLFMGIDVDDEVDEAQKGLQSGQADALFLGVLNPDTKQITVIGIDRNTMTTFDVYDENGQHINEEYGQITLAHAYGDGKKLSAENTVKAVSQLLFDIPIHGYCALNIAAVPALNDAVGGVEVTALDNIPTGIKKGESTLLLGRDAYYYVRYRDITVEESARGRLERQKQYLTAYITKAKQAFLENPTLPVQLYQAVTPYLTTDITLDEVIYLAGDVSGYTFSQNNLILIPGTTDVSGQFDEFYPDEEAMKRIIVDVFYTPVDDLS
jgi:LCP family protein required for cell wall assembly